MINEGNERQITQIMIFSVKSIVHIVKNDLTFMEKYGKFEPRVAIPCWGC